MAYLIHLKKFADERGVLSVIQSQLPFEVKRLYWIYDVPKGIKRGGHRHHRAIQALVCFGGSCTIYNNDGEEETFFKLNDPSKVLIIEPKDWHIMYRFTKQATLLVLASTTYDLSDYIDEPYPNSPQAP